MWKEIDRLPRDLRTWATTGQLVPWVSLLPPICTWIRSGWQKLPTLKPPTSSDKNSCKESLFLLDKESGKGWTLSWFQQDWIGNWFSWPPSQRIRLSKRTSTAGSLWTWAPPQEAATRLKDVVCGRWVWGIGKMDVIHCHYALLLPSPTQVSGVELGAEPLYPPGCNEIECSSAKQG